MVCPATNHDSERLLIEIICITRHSLILLCDNGCFTDTLLPASVVQGQFWAKIFEGDAPTKSRCRVSSAESGKISGNIGMVFLPKPRGLRERHELIQWSAVQSPAEKNAFGRILKATERSFLHLYADALSSSLNVSCHIWGQGQGSGKLPPLPQRRTTPGVIYISLSSVNMIHFTHFNRNMLFIQLVIILSFFLILSVNLVIIACLEFYAVNGTH